ncbi:MAG: Type II secretory pathway pseudopilin PulG-like protein [Candidatus Berkelbacteria bacterium Gr01-1014_85]|uniref:Type II secretory pathway pseudopilin PulG-like protein n=1 Tax=Candidatus Berkelbacteria bacterium Gr01-1014_85 TaxID=2017150 RepID=A0A554JAJ9_9BACT|nr:MAG: Type II secretory pathway pseudopilin PulG-like protein [Candidatus Berkelbacteria bacterium Gr01-1014_85]
MKRTGFNLVELLIAMAIISLILVLSLAGLNQARVRARDRQRINDLRSIQAALIQYRLEYGRFPNPADSSECPDQTVANANRVTPTLATNSCLTRILADQLPTDPQGGAYTYQATSAQFKLEAKLERSDWPEAKRDASPEQPDLLTLTESQL